MSRFSIIPDEVIRDRRLTLIQTRVLIALFRHRGKDTNVVFPKREALAHLTGYTVQNISKATRELESLGWLKKTGVGGRKKSCEYAITVPELNTVYDEETVSEHETVSEPETVSGSDTKTVSGPDTKTVSGSDTPLKKEEQTKEQTREQTNSTASAATPLIATFAKLGFDVLQVRRPKVIGMLNQWAAEGVTPDDITTLVQLKREEYPNNPIASPMYFQGAMHDYLEAKRHEPKANSGTHRSRTPSRSEQHQQASDIIRRDLARHAREMGDGVPGEDGEPLPREVDGEVCTSGGSRGR